MTNISSSRVKQPNKKRSLLLGILPAILAVSVVSMPVRSQVLDAVEDIAGDVVGDVFGGLGDIGEFIFALVDDLLEDINLAQWRTTIEGILGGNGSCLGQDLPILTFLPLEEGDYCAGGGNGSGSDGDNSSNKIEDIVVDAQGEMGIPDPNKIRRVIEEKVADASINGVPDILEVNPVVWGVYAANQTGRDLTALQISTVLGEEGQKQTKKQLESDRATVKSIATLAQDAQELDVTQDVMKKQVAAFAQQSVILGALRADSLQARHDTQFTNLNLKNASRTLDELARNERVSSISDAMLLTEISAQSRLQ